MEIYLSKNEEDQLMLIERGLRTNEKLSYDKTLIDSLIKKELLVTNGMSIRFTPQGEEALKAIKKSRGLT